MASLNNIVNVALAEQPKSVQRANMNIACLVTSEGSTAKRVRSYLDLASVANDFGTYSSVYQHAKVFFARSKNPANSGGYLVVGYWRASDETVPATAGYLRGAQLSAINFDVADGSFSINIDGTLTTVSNVDLRGARTLEEVANRINVSGATVSVEDNRLVITSNTTGATSSVGFAGVSNTGTFIGEMLGLASGTGAVTVAGADQTVLAPESKEDAVLAIREKEAIRGVVFIDKPTDAEVRSLRTLGESIDCVFYDVFSDSTNLALNPNTNVCYETALAGTDVYRMMYRKDGDRRYATAMMSLVHSVNLNFENSAITTNLKELPGITPEDYTQTEINACKKIGLDIYTTFAGVPKNIASDGNGYVDNVYNLIAMKLDVQVDIFNTLGTTLTKIPQTDGGMLTLVATIEETLEKYVRAGVIAPGKWTLPDTFGNPEVFKRAIETKGYYVKAGAISDQAASDREARKSTPIQVAVKNAGAIHTADIIINFNI